MGQGLIIGAIITGFFFTVLTLIVSFLLGRRSVRFKVIDDDENWNEIDDEGYYWPD